MKAILFGVVQGTTEWLPISSTGHMILLDGILRLDASEAFLGFFLVAIQFGSILAVLVLFFGKLNPCRRGKTKEERRMAIGRLSLLLIACLPAALTGLFLDDWIEETCYNFPVIATTLIGYGILFILLERRRKNASFRITSVDSITARDAFFVGCFQVLALIPGTSRSGATIFGASLLGIGRTAAAEFSFFMAIPVMAGASLLKGAKFALSGQGITPTETIGLTVGTATAFLVSLITIRFLIEFVRRRSFEVFGWYRVALGAAVLLFGGIL